MTYELYQVIFLRLLNDRKKRRKYMAETMRQPQQLDLISAFFDPIAMRVTALTQQRCYEFEVYTQDMLDAYLTIDNCSEFLKERSDLPQRYSSYGEWANAIFAEGNEMEIMLDDSYHEQWPEICKMANINCERYPFSSLCYEDSYQSVPVNGSLYALYTCHRDEINLRNNAQ